MPVAKIEGWASYKTTMAALTAPDLGSTHFSDHLLQQSDASQSAVGAPNISSTPIYNMLRALSTATDAYLEGREVDDIGVAVPFDIFEDQPCLSWRYDLLAEATKRAGLPRPIPSYVTAAEAACRWAGIGDCSKGQPCTIEGPDLPEILVLAVHYSRSSLGATLIRSYFGELDPRRHEISLVLGHNAAGAGTADQADHWTEVKQLIQRVASLPTPYRYDPRIISELIVHGDRTDSIGFQNALKEALGDELAAAQKTFATERAMDPVFAVAQGTLYWAWCAEDSAPEIWCDRWDWKNQT